MRRAVRVFLFLLVFVFWVAGGAGAYFYYLDTAPPAQRPELLRLPDGIGQAPQGWPTWNACLLWFGLGWVDTLDPNYDWPVAENSSLEEDVEYGRVGDRPLLLDLYRPKLVEAPAPCLVFVHGGGWYMGDKKHYRYYGARYAAKGYVVASVGYRFSQEAPFPGCVEDVKCAIRWIRHNAEKMRVDPERIAVIGGSAGGHLSMMAGYSSDDPSLEGQGGWEGVSSKVAAVVDLYGPTDATVAGLRDMPLAVRFMGCPYEEDPERYKKASPIQHLKAGSPPTLVIHGTIDHLVPIAQSDALVEKLRQLQVPHYYARLDGWPHTLDIEPQMNAYVEGLMDAFFAEYLLS